MPLQQANKMHDERTKALRYLMFLKEKQDGTIKVCWCMDGRPQRQYTSKEEVSSPTVSLEAMMLCCAIDAKENRCVVITEIPGAFLHTDMEDYVHMLLEGTIAKLIIKLEPSLYRKYVWYDRNRKTNALSTVKNVLYGMLQAALLFWKLLSNTLQDWGFKINKYNQSVASNIIQGKQCMIMWHVYDLKISHVDKDVIEEIVEKLTTKFGQDTPLTTNRGKVLDYLGIRIYYRKKGKVTFSMEDYIKKILEEAPCDMEGTAKRVSACHLFNTNDREKKLSEEKTQLFHHIVAKLLYLCRRTQQYIQTAVAFLFTRVK